MYSIKDRLVKSLTIIIGAILLFIFLSLHFVIGAWMDKQFDEALIDKSNYLKSLVEVNPEGIEFEYHEGFMPQFERKEDAQFFQIWFGSEPFARSHSLSFYHDVALELKNVVIHEDRIFQVKLPDGRMGRGISTRFQPQISPKVNKESLHFVGSMSLTLMISNQKLNNFLLLADLSLVFVFFTAIFGMRVVVINVVDRELKSLYTLNKEISELSATDKKIKKNTKESKEIAPIRKELNRYIELNTRIIDNEKRLSSDIAHELKTPIAELISLSEMNIRFPDDSRISETYKDDVLSISENMKSIVNQLMLLHKSRSEHQLSNKKEIALCVVIDGVMDELWFKYPQITQQILCRYDSNIPMVLIDKLSMEIVMKNLIDNALFYRDKQIPVTISMSKGECGGLMFEIKNTVSEALTQNDVDNLFEPLYQVDKSRTHAERHGLGLSIVKNLCEINNVPISLSYNEDIHEISFHLAFSSAAPESEAKGCPPK